MDNKLISVFFMFVGLINLIAIIAIVFLTSTIP